MQGRIGRTSNFLWALDTSVFTSSKDCSIAIFMDACWVDRRMRDCWLNNDIRLQYRSVAWNDFPKVLRYNNRCYSQGENLEREIQLGLGRSSLLEKTLRLLLVQRSPSQAVPYAV